MSNSCKVIGRCGTMQVIMRKLKPIPHTRSTARGVYAGRSLEESTRKTLGRFIDEFVKSVRKEPVLPKQKPLDPVKEEITLMSPVGNGKEGLF